MNCHDAQSMLGDYALGLLPEPDAVQLERHLDAGCLACRQELAEVQEALFAMVEEEPLAVPPTRLKDDLFARLDEAQVSLRPPSTRSHAPIWQLLAAGLAVAAVGVWVLQSDDAESLPAAQTALQEWRQQIEGTNRQLGLGMTNLVSMQIPSADDRRPLSYLLLDRASNEMHLWTQPPTDPDAPAANWVWLLDTEGAVVGSRQLVPRGDRYAAVVGVQRVEAGSSFELLLTNESTSAGDKPGEEVIERVTLRF